MAKKNRVLVKNANIRKLIDDEKQQQAKLAQKRARRKENAAAFAEILEKRKAELMKEAGGQSGGPSISSGSSSGIFGFGASGPSPSSSASKDNKDDAIDGGETARKRKTVLKMLGRLSVKKRHLKPKKAVKTREENRPGELGKILKARRLSEDKRDRITVQKRRMVNKFGVKVFRFRNVECRREKLVRRQLEKRQRIGPKPPKKTASGKKKKVKVSTKKQDRMKKRAARRERKRLQNKSKKRATSGRSGMQVSPSAPQVS